MSIIHGGNASTQLRPVRTVDSSETIWSAISEDEFRTHLVTLERRTNAVPIDVLTAPVAFSDGIDESGILPLGIEKSLADDLAYIAAVTEGAQSVAAVCLEQYVGTKLVVRVAGMDAVDEKVKEMLNGIAQILERSHSDGVSSEDLADLQELVFTMISDHHWQKLLGRMRSSKWQKPAYLRRTHKKPLWKDFDNVTHRIRHVYPKRAQGELRDRLTACVTSLAKEYEEFETATLETRLPVMKRLIKATYAFCMIPAVQTFASTIADITVPTPQIAAAVKTLRQLEKIGAYWRIARSLLSIATRYPSVFRRVEMEYLVPFADAPTAIAHESWAKTMHVHAEVQLVVEYTLRRQEDQYSTESHHHHESTVVWPRTIGTSKYLCYLCHLFLREHGMFGHVLNSHGRLFDQWTVPDLKEYDDQTRAMFADVLRRVDQCVQSRTDALSKDVVWRAEPMTSRQNLLSSIETSDAADY